MIEATRKPKAFDLCRRGALLRKLGMVKKAEEDLNRYISVLDKLTSNSVFYFLVWKSVRLID